MIVFGCLPFFSVDTPRPPLQRVSVSPQLQLLLGEEGAESLECKTEQSPAQSIISVPGTWFYRNHRMISTCLGFGNISEVGLALKKKKKKREIDMETSPFPDGPHPCHPPSLLPLSPHYQTLRFLSQPHLFLSAFSPNPADESELGDEECSFQKWYTYKSKDPGEPDIVAYWGWRKCPKFCQKYILPLFICLRAPWPTWDNQPTVARRRCWMSPQCWPNYRAITHVSGRVGCYSMRSSETRSDKNMSSRTSSEQ